MKKIFIALTLACAAFVFSGCEDRLDVQQHGVISMEDFYQTDEDAEAALVNVYYTAGRFLSNSMFTDAGWNECPLLNPFEYASDDMYCSGENKADGVSGNQINAFWLDSNNDVIAGSWESYYMIINAANLVIDHFAEAADTKVKKRCVAEARVFRAHAHLLLALGWGTPPIVDHCLTGADRPGNAESQKAVLEFVVKDLDQAVGDLDERSSTTDMDGAVKITKGFAYALKGKALMFLGDYNGAKEALKKVIDSKKYDLVPSEKMTSLYHYSGRGNEETVFEFNLKYDATVTDYYWRAQPNFKSLWGWRASKIAIPHGAGSELPENDGWGWYNPSKKFVDALLENDGYDSARRKAWIKSYDEILYEMPYGSDKDCPTLADKKKDPKRGVTASDGVYGNVGWFMWKRLYRQEDWCQAGEIQWNLVVMRYAEVLLMYAECCAQTGDNSGLQYLNKIQERAQAKHKSTSLTLAEVQKEKFLECWMEGCRFVDLVRWGIADKELANNGKYLPNWCDEMVSKGAAEHKGYIDDHDATWCTTAHPEMGFKKGKNELFPFPFRELNVNPNLVQNPGY